MAIYYVESALLYCDTMYAVFLYIFHQFLTNLMKIPAAAIYGIFIYDFGEREHVFQPVRP